MIIIRTPKEIEHFWNESRGAYVFDNDVIFECSIEVKQSIIADGFIIGGGSIKTQGFIRSGGLLEVGGSINVGEFVKADWNIKVVRWLIVKKSITSEGFIEVAGPIAAGDFIKTSKHVLSLSFDIRTLEIATKTLPFWRKFWAEMPPLRKFRSAILSNTCWEELRDLPTLEEKKEICAWDGWHWLLRGQLECFLGLRDSFCPPVQERKVNRSIHENED